MSAGRAVKFVAEQGMALSPRPSRFASALAAPARWTFLPGFIRALYALVVKRLFGLVKRPVIADVPDIGLMRLEPWDLIDSRLLFFNIWEPAVSRFMRTTIKPGDVVADIGANIGYHTLLMSHAVGPHGHVFAVEPSPEIRSRLEDALALNTIQNVTVIPFGISDRAERRAFHLSEVNLGASKFGELDESGLALKRLADVIPAVMLSRLSFIKLDVEGMEAAVMRDIVSILPRLPRRLSICAELRMDDALQALVQTFRNADMDALVLPNEYSMFRYPAHPITPIPAKTLATGQLDVALVRR